MDEAITAAFARIKSQTSVPVVKLIDIVTEGQVSLDLNPLPAGTYIVRIQTADNITARRIIVAR